MKSLESFCKKAIEMGIEGAKITAPGSARGNGFPIEVVRMRDEVRNIFGLVLVE